MELHLEKLDNKITSLKNKMKSIYELQIISDVKTCNKLNLIVEKLANQIDKLELEYISKSL